MSDIYAAPDSELTENNAASEYGSIEKGLSGDFDLSLGSVLGDAWELSKGAKRTLLGAFVIYILGYAIVNTIVAGILGFLLSSLPIISMIATGLLVSLLITPLWAGTLMIAIKRAGKGPIKASFVFNYYDKMIPLFLTVVIMYIAIFIGFILLVIPGIYLSIAYALALPLVVEKGLSPWQALETSRKAITKKWFSMLIISIVSMLIFLVSALPLGIGLIWTVPWLILASGVVYRNVFGIQKSNLEPV